MVPRLRRAAEELSRDLAIKIIDLKKEIIDFIPNFHLLQESGLISCFAQLNFVVPCLES